jgi:hypothetical protein
MLNLYKLRTSLVAVRWQKNQSSTPHVALEQFLEGIVSDTAGPHAAALIDSGSNVSMQCFFQD